MADYATRSLWAIPPPEVTHYGGLSMRMTLISAVMLLTAATSAVAAPDNEEQEQFEQFVSAAGASNGAARSCGASAPDLAEHQANASKNLRRYAQEYGFAVNNFEREFRDGQAEGQSMMESMRRSGSDGCTGVLAAFQHERTIGYDDMKQALAEVSDGLPGEKAP